MRCLGVIAIACVGCATSYDAATSHQTIGRGRYLITADGNAFTSRSRITQYVYRRATELCGAGFDLLDADTATTTHVATFDGGKTYNTFNKSSGALAIECRAPVRPRELRAAPAATAPARRKVVTGARPIYCTASVAEPDHGMCSLSAESCATFRATLTSDGTEFTPCEPATAAACFNAVRVLDDDRVTRCAPTVTGCELQLAALKTNADYTVSARECGVYRATAP